MKRFLLSLLITAAIFIALFSQISLKDLFSLLRGIEFLWMILGLAGYLLATLLRALRYQWLIHSKNIFLADLFRITVYYNLSLMVLPSKLGELTYPYLLNKIRGLSMTEGLASLVSSRVYDFFIVSMIFLFASMGFQGFFKIRFAWVIVLTALLILVILLLLFYMGELLVRCSNLLNCLFGWAGGAHKPLQWIQTKMREMAEDFHAIKARRTYLPVAITSLASWILIFWMFYALMRGFGVETSFPTLVFGSTVALIASALPISGLGNWGTLEAGWAAGFLITGLSKEQAITTGFGVHIVVFLFSALMAFFCWIPGRRPDRS